MPPEITETTVTAETAEQLAALEAEAKAKAKAEAKAAEKAKAEEAAKAAALAEQEAAAKLKAEEDEKAAAAKLQADAEGSQTLNDPDQFDVAEKEEEPLDMSLEARMARAKDALADAIDAQNQINRIVADKTTALDELIIEQAGSPDNNPMSEIQFYLTAQQRKREQKAEQRKQMLGQGIDPAELIRRLDGRAPVDQRPPAKRKNPAALKAVKQPTQHNR